MSNQQSNSTEHLVFELLSIAENYILPINRSNTAIVTEFSVDRLARYIEANYLPREQVEAAIGEDFPKPPLGDLWNVGRNQLRAEIRSKLKDTMYSGRPIPEANETKEWRKN